MAQHMSGAASKLPIHQSASRLKYHFLLDLLDEKYNLISIARQNNIEVK